MISLKKTLKALAQKINSLSNSMGDVPHRTLLWTNPNPLTEFPAQTISLDLKDYDTLEIVGDRLSADWAGRYYGSIFLEDKGKRHTMSIGGNEIFRYRAYTFNDNGVVVADGRQCNTYGSSSSVNNLSNSPVKIYGIKWGGTVGISRLLKVLGGRND